MSQDSGLIRRGFFLLAAIGLLVAGVLSILFNRPTQAVPEASARTDHSIALAVTSQLTFPNGIPWASLHALASNLPSARGWEIRYNAATALARRGSTQVPWKEFEEMLDESRQMRNFRVQLQDGREVPDETTARLAMISELRALAEWHKKRKEAGKTEAPADLQAVYAKVDLLAKSPIAELRKEAETARLSFFR